MLEVEDPIIEDFGTVFDIDDEIPTFDEIDRTILECCGYEEGSSRYNMIMENVVADSDDEKIFTIDKNRSYKLEAAVEEIVKDDTFDRYWHRLVDSLEDERDGLLLEQLTDGFIFEEAKRYLNSLSKVESVNYIDLFREILSKTENPDTLTLIDFDDEAFNEMPKVMRLY